MQRQSEHLHELSPGSQHQLATRRLPGQRRRQPRELLRGNCGSVAYSCDISGYEITNTQYAEFLNAKAASDPLGRYNPSIGSDGTNGGIIQSGISGSFSYAVKSGFENKPVTYVSPYSALRFANWVNNGGGLADTETGTRRHPDPEQRHDHHSQRGNQSRPAQRERVLQGRLQPRGGLLRLSLRNEHGADLRGSLGHAEHG
jgi:hypothetical protein